ncbi:hypothetical protein LOD99_16245 [Oopsacas minuta]|uniref:Uncharacterized protein n=1 Tax=Oopsacas minuta TaxID=111878 RepID=A0AAV7K753_9METZ|nr:hypothetical protein LOD99_16245 [Oopsacas minuta]
MAEIFKFKINLDKDIKQEVEDIKSRLNTYFSQLIKSIQHRQTQLISELDEIVSHYGLERFRIREKIHELEKMRKYHQDNYTSSSVKGLHDAVLDRCNTELSELQQKHSDILTIDVEWTKGYAKYANEIGKVKVNSEYPVYSPVCSQGIRTPSPTSLVSKSNTQGRSYYKYTEKIFPMNSDTYPRSSRTVSKETVTKQSVKRKLHYDCINILPKRKETEK